MSIVQRLKDWKYRRTYRESSLTLSSDGPYQPVVCKRCRAVFSAYGNGRAHVRRYNVYEDRYWEVDITCPECRATFEVLIGDD